jgi:hypothetical protein
MARIELSNIGGGGTTLSLTTTGTSGASTLAGSVLNIPIYQGQLTLTTTGTSGAATLSGDILNIPQYSGGGGTPAGSAGQVQFNSTPAGSFAASSNLAWDNTNVRLNIGAPSSPTGRLNVKGAGTLSSTVNLRLTDSGNTELVKVLDNGYTNIGTGFNWDNPNSRLGIGTSAFITTPDPVTRLQIDDNSTGFPRQFVVRATAAASRAQFSIQNDVGTSFLAQVGGSAYAGTLLRNSVLLGSVGANTTELLILTDATQPDVTTAPIRFRTGGYSNGNSMVITSGNRGNVGIGLDSPGARLNVQGSNTSGGTNALLVQNSTPSDIYKIENNGKITYWATNTAAGTTGAQTINRPSGTVNFLGSTSALVVTNSLCTASSIVFATVRTNDTTAYIKNVVPAAGSFTINLGANATAETSVGFFIIN